MCLMWCKKEMVGIKETKVTDVCGSENRGAIDAEGEVLVGFGERFGDNDEDIGFV